MTPFDSSDGTLPEKLEDSLAEPCRMGALLDEV